MYYFSGTGNSLYVCRHLAGLLGESVCPMTSPVPSDDASVGLVFPVYAWGIPNVVERFVREHDFSGRFLYAVMTCGDDVGYADNVLRKALGGRLDAVFSVQMPNTYVCLPGFDVDKDDVAQAKVESTLLRLPSIAEYIMRREKRTDVVRGACAWLKTYVLRPMFNRFLVTDKYFHVVSKQCTQCKRCVRGCPLGNMAMDEKGNVVWKHENCTACLRCYHRCPNKAVQFGRFTKNKGQKIHDFD